MSPDRKRSGIWHLRLVDDWKRPISGRSDKVSNKKPKGFRGAPKKGDWPTQKIDKSGVRAL